MDSQTLLKGKGKGSKGYKLSDLPEPLTHFGVSDSAPAIRGEIKVHTCLSCGVSFESDFVSSCPCCESNLLYSEDSFLPDSEHKPVLSLVDSDVAPDFSQSRVSKSLDAHLVPTLADSIAAYTFPIKTTRDRAAANTDWQSQLFSLLRKHRDFAPSMFKSFVAICDSKNYFDALAAVEDASSKLVQMNHDATMSEGDIKLLASEKAIGLRKRLASVDCEEERFEIASQFMAFLGLSFDEKEVAKARDNDELFALVNRACDEIWLRRQLRRLFAQRVDNVARELSLVHKQKQAYCCDFSVNRYAARAADNRECLENTIAFDEDDETNSFSLAELSDKSVSNPEVRAAEMFVRLKGFEQLSKELGHSAMFTTVTAPSRFHAVSKGMTNPKWVTAGKPTPNDAQDYLIKVWTEFRKSLDKAKIKIYGMRIVEPHHDGTPHHHMLIFGLPCDLRFAKKELRRIAMLDSPKEPGAKEHRFKCEDIKADYVKSDGSKGKGSAVAYIAKYLCKNIDGKSINKDLATDLKPVESANRIVTWARIHGIRQFQFFGGPSVTVWREMRRLREEIKEGDAVFKDINPDEHYLLEKVRKSADEGDWAAFCMAMGGVFVKRNDQTVKAHYAVPTTIEKLFGSDEVTFQKTRYGDNAHARVNGILFRNVFKATRFRNWNIVSREAYIAGRKKVMEGVVDIFDVMILEREYEAMCEQAYHEYEKHVQECEEMQALFLDASAWQGSEATEVMKH